MHDLPPELEIPDALKRAQKLANLTDTAIRIPVLGVRLGLDFLIGLIPGFGDLIMLMVSGSIIASANQLGVPRSKQKIMWRNCALDFLLGLTPGVGDVADLFFKANRANVKIMEQWWLEQNSQALKQHTQQSLEKWQDNLKL